MIIKKPAVYVLLPVHNRLQLTRKFIGCLKNQDYENIHLVLIDDGSTDGTAEMVAEQFRNLTVIKGEGDWWWAGSLNKGIECLDQKSIGLQDIVLFINDDVFIDNAFISTGVNLLLTMPKTLLLAQRRDPDTGKIIESGYYADVNKFTFNTASSEDSINCFSTCGLFTRWKDIKEIGLFRARLLPHYGSDFEYTLRASKKGFNLVTLPSLNLICNSDTSGIKSIENGKLLECLKSMFDKKCAINPVYWTALVLLVCPVRFILPNIIKVWYRSARIINGAIQ